VRGRGEPYGGGGVKHLQGRRKDIFTYCKQHEKWSKKERKGKALIKFQTERKVLKKLIIIKEKKERGRGGDNRVYQEEVQFS